MNATIDYYDNESEVTKFDPQMLIDTLICCDSLYAQVSPCRFNEYVLYFEIP